MMIQWKLDEAGPRESNKIAVTIVKIGTQIAVDSADAPTDFQKPLRAIPKQTIVIAKRFG